MGTDQKIKTILLVEDDSFVAAMEKQVLENDGYHVLLAGSGEDAIRRVAAIQADCENLPPGAAANTIDLILMDITLGRGMDGTQAAGIILARQDIPIIFLTAHSDRELMDKAEALTPYGYIVKSSNPTALLAPVRMAFKLHEAHTQISRSESRYRRMIETAYEGIWTMDAAGRTDFINPQGAAILGYQMDEMLGCSPADFFFPEEAAYCLLELEKNRRGQQVTQVYRMRHKQGGEVWVQARTAPILECNGQTPLGFLWMFDDYSTRKESDDQIKTLLNEKEVLLREVHHRIKNNMSTIASLLQLQMCAQEAPTVKKALEDAEIRVRSMMVLYDKLYRSENFNSLSIGEYFPPLLEEIMGIFPHRDCVRLCTDLEDIELRTEYLYPLGIILNELTTNAMKYAFVGRTEGTIRLAARRDGSQIQIVFEDDGVGAPEGFSVDDSGGFGMYLVSLLMHQIHGAIHVECGRGTRFNIRFEVRVPGGYAKKD